MTISHGYDTYQKWTFIPPLVSSCITLAFLTLLIVASAILKCDQLAVCSRGDYSVDSYLRLVKVTFGKHIKKIEDKFFFYCYEISKLQIIMLATITVVIFMTTFMSFWVSFIVQETFGCDPQLDCFIRDPSTHDVFSKEPLDNCTYDSTNGTVVCFQFAFDFSGGFSAAVGFMGVAVVYCRMYIYVLIWFRELCECRTSKNVYTVFVSVVMYTVTALITFGIVSVIRSVSDVLFMTNKSKILYFSYFITFGYIGPFAGFYIAFVLRGAKKIAPTDNDEDENRHSINRTIYAKLQED